MSSRRRSTGPPGGWRSGLSSRRFRLDAGARAGLGQPAQPARPLPPVGGLLRLHGIEPHEVDVTCRWASASATPWCWAPRAWADAAGRAVHHAGHPPQGPRRARGGDRLRPWGDADLLKRMYVGPSAPGAKASSTCSIWAGRTSRRATTRWAGSGGSPRWPRASPGQLSGEGNSAAFREFAWRFVNIIARALVELGQRPDYPLIQRHVINIDALFIEYAQHYFAKNEPKAWEVIVQLEAKLNDKNIPRNMIGREKRVVALEQYRPKCASMTRCSTACAAPCATTGRTSTRSSLRCCRCWRSSPPARSRNCSHRTIPTCPTRDRSSTGCRSSANARWSTWAGCAVRRQSRRRWATDVQRSGLGRRPHLQVRHRRRAARRRGGRQIPINVHADEFNELMGDEFIPMVNKGGGAGVQVTAYTQTLSDIEARIGNRAKAGQVVGNFNNLFMLRVRETATAELLTRQLPKVEVYATALMSGATDSSDPHGNTAFTSNTQDRISSNSVPLIEPAHVVALPKGSASR